MGTWRRGGRSREIDEDGEPRELVVEAEKARVVAPHMASNGGRFVMRALVAREGVERMAM